MYVIELLNDTAITKKLQTFLNFVIALIHSDY